MNINGWNFRWNTKYIRIADDKGNKYRASVVTNNRILIEKDGTARILKYPKFVIEYVEEELKRLTDNNNLVMMNEILANSK